MDVVTYALAKKMTSSVASGIVEVQTDGTNIRFKTANGDWFSVRLNSVDGATISSNGHLIIELTDGTTLDAGALPLGTMDSSLSTTSENGVQNKVITNALGDLNSLCDTKLSIVASLPITPHNQETVLYVGTSDDGLKSGGIYQYQVSEWVMIFNVSSFTFNSDEFIVDSTTNEVSLKPSYADIPSFLPNNASASNKLVTQNELEKKQDFRIFNSLEEFNEKKGTSLTVVSGIDNMKDIANAMSNGEILIIITKCELGSEVYFGLTTDTGWTKMFTFVKSNGLCDVECCTSVPFTFKRVLNSDGVIGDWQELATTDSTLKTIQLSGSVDCNTLTEPGLYTASAGAVSALTGSPSDLSSAVQLSGGFSILVTKTNVDNVYYGMQMFIPYSSDVPFIRKSYYLNGQYWTPWEQLATMNNVARDVDTSYMSNGVLNILSIRQSLGVGCYEIMGQGNSGHGSIRLNIWQVSSGAFAFSCCITDFSGVRSICNNEGDSTTVDVGTSYFETTNRIVKIF